MATSSMSSDRLERVGQDLGAVRVGAEGHDHEPEIHPDPQLRRVVHREPALDPDVIAELHEADAVGLERLQCLAAGIGLLRAGTPGS